MEKVFTSPNLSDVDLVKTLLTADGILCHLQNQHSAHGAAGGFGAMAFAWPEVWVAEGDVEAAKCIIQGFLEGRG
ncbi:MAG: hypothetical protein ACI9X0_003045 [Kiritimatiellia bacterium]|jgi:hypothetical protein